MALAALWGFFFALVQLGEFQMLQLYHSSGVWTYFGVSSAWLLGTLMGLVCAVSARVQVVLQLAGFWGVCWFLGDPVGFAFVALGGFGVGAFLRRWQTRMRADRLLLWENNGFLVGIPSTLGLFAWWGRPGAMLAVSVAGVFLLLLRD